MLELIKVKKKYKEELLWDNINIKISRPGLYGIIGKSGSGKTTLLNIIGILDDDFEGDYYFNNKNVKGMKEKEKEDIRFNYFSYIFQSPKLIENESIITNLSLGVGRELKIEEVKKVLQKVNLYLKPTKIINTLSGGEKQRINLALALLKDTPFILGDEITSGLDEKNKKEILSILSELSKTKIIILITHDAELLKNYTTNIYSIFNKTLPKITSLGSISINKTMQGKNELKNTYIFKHVLNIINKKKIRTIVSLFSSIIALVCLGICLMLTSSFADAMMSALGDSINQYQIVMENKEKSFLIDEEIALNEKETNQIGRDFYEKIRYQGVYYLNTFIDLFSINDTYLKFEGRNISLPGYSLDTINNYHYFNENDCTYLYTNSMDLKNNEVIISLSRGRINALCNLLNIEYESDACLLDYFSNNIVSIYFHIENPNWDYDLTIPFQVVGYEVSSDKNIYHSFSKWNEYVIEEIMQLPYSYKLNEEDYYPWTTKKINYLSLENDKELDVIEKLLLDEKYDDYTFKIFSHNDAKNIYFEYAHDNSLRISNIESIIDSFKELETYIPCNNNGFSFVKEALLEGFTYPTFLCDDYQVIEEYIEYNSYSDNNLGIYQSTILENTSDSLYSLSLLNASKDTSIHLKTYNNEKENIIGRYPRNEKEIIISSKLAKQLNLFYNNEYFTEKQTFIFSLTDIVYSNEKYRNEYNIVKVNIVGIVNDDTENYLYVNKLWPITFLLLNMNKDQASLFPDSAIFSYKGNDIFKILEELNSKYPDLTFSNPYLEYKTKIDDTISYIEKGLNLFSLFCLISSLLMVILTSYLFVVNTKKEIGIYTYLGYKRKSIKKQFKAFSMYLCTYSCLVSCFCLLVIMTLFNSDRMGIKISFSVNSLKPFVSVIFISYIIGLISSYFSIRNVLKEKPIKQLQEN